MSSPESLSADGETGIAIIGMSGRFPGAPDLETFWRNLRDGVESISFFSPAELAASGVPAELIADPAYVPARGILDDPEGFDAPLFGFSPGEAERMDPQHRVFLECAWEALDDAGYDPARIAGPVGVFAGASLNAFALSRLHAALATPGESLLAAIANDRDFLPTRVSHKLNLRGPSLSVGTACSTSLVAVHLACQSLLSGECDVALAGAVRIATPQKSGFLHRPGDIVAPDGHCRAFDARAQGTVGGNGAGVVVLKRLADARADGDAIRAVVRGSAVNNDGAEKIGYTAPGIAGQAAVIREALAVAGVSADEIGYVEAHGTGTALGDPVEVAALTQAFRHDTARTGFCRLGSVKTNIGHLDAAAGMAGLIKAVLLLENGEIPPSLHFETPNPGIDFAASPFTVNAALGPWPRGAAPRLAGVSSFGLGGTNAHVILEEAPPPCSSPPSPSPRRDHLLVLSARSAAALETATDRLAEHLQQHPAAGLADIAYTLQAGRAALEHRRLLVCPEGSAAADAAAALAGRDPERVFTGRAERQDRPVVFLLPGQGTQYVNAGRELYDGEPAFRRSIDRCAEILAPDLGLDLRDVLYPPAGREREARERLHGVAVGQPAAFVLDYAVAQLWIEHGVRPAALLGHSLGEVAAACLAGVLTLPDALRLIAERSRLIDALPPGGTLAVALPAAELAGRLGGDLCLAADNAPDLCLVSGPAAAVEALAGTLSREGVLCGVLPIPRAVHSAHTEPILDALAAAVGRLELRAPAIPYLSNVTGDWITADEATSPAYWVRHLREPVRFRGGLDRLLAEPATILLEVGAGRALTALARRHPLAGSAAALLTSLPPREEPRPAGAFFQSALGRLWLAGAAVDWNESHRDERRRRIPLPAYPFERSGSACPAALETPAPSAPPEGEPERRLAAIWSALLGVDRVGLHDNFFELGGHSLLALSLIGQVERELGARITLSTLAAAPTVAGLALRLGVGGDSAQHSPLVALHSGGSAAPFFCVHPAGGHVLCYADLARHLGRPFFGLQVPDVEGDGALPDIPGLASLYVRSVMEARPAGPLLLGGWSMGGVIAFEMARQLAALGRPAALVALLDADAPGQDSATRAAAEADDLLLFARALELTRNGTPPWGGGDALRWIAGRLEQDGVLTGGDALMQVQRMHRTFVHCLHITTAYEPKPYTEPAAVFRVRDRPMGGTGSPGLGWESVCSRLEVQELPGDHWSLFREPLVRGLAAKLSLCLTHAEIREDLR